MRDAITGGFDWQNWEYQNQMNARDPFTGIQIQGPQQAPVMPENAPDWFQAPPQQQQTPFSFGGQEYGALQSTSDRYAQAIQNQKKWEDRMANSPRTPQQTRAWRKQIQRSQNDADIAKRGFSGMMGQYLGQDFGGSDPMALLGAYGGVEGFDPYLQQLISGAVQGMPAQPAPPTQMPAPPQHPMPAQPPGT